MQALVILCLFEFQVHPFDFFSFPPPFLLHLLIAFNVPFFHISCVCVIAFALYHLSFDLFLLYILPSPLHFSLLQCPARYLTLLLYLLSKHYTFTIQCSIRFL